MSNFGPCSCVGINTTPDVTPDSNPDCLALCDIVILANSDDAVGPCGKTGTIDVTEEKYGHNTEICGDSPLQWSVASYEGTIADATITLGGVLSWVTGGSTTANSYSTIILKGCCGEYGAYMTVIVGTKDLCNCPECPACNNCDPCTGDCLDGETDLDVGGS